MGADLPSVRVLVAFVAREPHRLRPLEQELARLVDSESVALSNETWGIDVEQLCEVIAIPSSERASRASVHDIERPLTGPTPSPPVASAPPQRTATQEAAERRIEERADDHRGDGAGLAPSVDRHSNTTTTDSAVSNSPRRQRIDDNVQFTVYRRSVIKPQQWYPLLAFAHLAEKRPDADADEPDPVQEVHDQARQVLGDDVSDFRSVTADSRAGVVREGELRFVPVVAGVQFNPPERRFVWTESVHREEFRMRATTSERGSARGVLTVYSGNLLLADIPLSITVDDRIVDASPVRSEARPYRNIFVSYSHRDAAIVEEFESHMQATGDRYMRDVIALRAGEQWNDRLRDLMKQADVLVLARPGIAVSARGMATGSCAEATVLCAAGI